jgi:hypothetical protein
MKKATSPRFDPVAFIEDNPCHALQVLKWISQHGHSVRPFLDTAQKRRAVLLRFERQGLRITRRRGQPFMKISDWAAFHQNAWRSKKGTRGTP